MGGTISTKNVLGVLKTTSFNDGLSKNILINLGDFLSFVKEFISGHRK
jgi:hypothetical protein